MKKVRANQILQKALRIRKQYLAADPRTPICPYNLAEAMGMDVRFLKIATFEGMYIANEGLILISSSRPEGRKRFTCAHELGHHVLGHGTVIDEVVGGASDKAIELEADFFAAMLLMPSSAIKYAANKMGIKDVGLISSLQVYSMAKYIGVSYEALLVQLDVNLGLLSSSRRAALLKYSPQKIAQELVPVAVAGDVYVIEEWWTGRAIDLVVGDSIFCSQNFSFEGASLNASEVGAGKQLINAVAPGIAKISSFGSVEWSSYIRVSRTNFEGMCQFRHEEEVE